MNSKVYKWCAVPHCVNTSIRTPNKVFVHVPNKKLIRDNWLKLARRNPNDVVTNSPLYFCEDHFDLPNDMENYMEYHVMGSVSQIRMKPGCTPKKFLCQDDSSKRTSAKTKRPSIVKKQRKILIDNTAEHDALTPVLKQQTHCQDVQTDLIRDKIVHDSDTFENLAENEEIVVKEENADVFETQIHMNTEIDDDQTEITKNIEATKHVLALTEDSCQMNEQQNVLEIKNKPKKNMSKKKKEAKSKRKITCSAKVFENALATGVNTIIARVYNFFKKEFDYLTKTYGDMLDLTPFCKYKERTAEATGFHINVIERVLKEEGQASEKNTRPQKRRRKEKKKDRQEDSETETCDETFDSGEESETRSFQPADQGDHSYAIPSIEEPTAIVKEEPLEELYEPELYVPPAGTSLVYETLKLMAAESDPLKIETESIECAETTYNHTMEKNPDEPEDDTNKPLSSMSEPMEVQDAVASTLTTPFAQPIIAASKSKAQKQREYRQRITASRTPAQAAAARKAKNERQRNHRLRQVANLAIASNSLETTTTSPSRSGEGSTNVQTRSQRQHAQQQSTTTTDQPDERVNLTNEPLFPAIPVPMEVQEAVASTSATPFAEPITAAPKTRAQIQRDYRQRIAASKTPAQAAAAREARNVRDRNNRLRQAANSVTASGSLEATTTSSSRSGQRLNTVHIDTQRQYTDQQRQTLATEPAEIFRMQSQPTQDIKVESAENYEEMQEILPDGILVVKEEIDIGEEQLS